MFTARVLEKLPQVEAGTHVTSLLMAVLKALPGDAKSPT
jgi:hypothetical protein